jgi:hypothetical protein
MSESTIRTAIYYAINDVANVGVVHSYERHSTSWDEFLNLFKTKIGNQEQVRGWMIGYRGILEATQLTFNSTVNPGTQRVHRFRIMGFMAINDANESEKTFADIAEDICDALDADSTLHSAGIHATPAAMSFDPRPFADVLIHAAIINIDVTEVV